MELYGSPMLLIRLAISVGRNDAANGCFDRRTGARRFLNPRRGLGAHVQIEAAGVGGWEEILAQPGHQKKRRCAR